MKRLNEFWVCLMIAVVIGFGLEITLKAITITSPSSSFSGSLDSVTTVGATTPNGIQVGNFQATGTALASGSAWISKSAYIGAGLNVTATATVGAVTVEGNVYIGSGTGRYIDIVTSTASTRILSICDDTTGIAQCFNDDRTIVLIASPDIAAGSYATFAVPRGDGTSYFTLGVGLNSVTTTVDRTTFNSGFRAATGTFTTSYTAPTGTITSQLAINGAGTGIVFNNASGYIQNSASSVFINDSLLLSGNVTTATSTVSAKFLTATAGGSFATATTTGLATIDNMTTGGGFAGGSGCTYSAAGAIQCNADITGNGIYAVTGDFTSVVDATAYTATAGISAATASFSGNATATGNMYADEFIGNHVDITEGIDAATATIPLIYGAAATGNTLALHDNIFDQISSVTISPLSGVLVNTSSLTNVITLSVGSGSTGLTVYNDNTYIWNGIDTATATIRTSIDSPLYKANGTSGATATVAITCESGATGTLSFKAGIYTATTCP